MIKTVCFTSKMKVHFIGIGGSGMSGVALIAKAQRYEVSGCDINIDTPYIKKIRDLQVPIFKGQDQKHLNGIDILAVTPAVFFQNADNPELKEGKKRKIVMTWQEFLGKYLQKGKKVICIAGTHGKSTTTAMASLLFEKANLDPSVMIGATVNEWGANYRVGKSDVFITEADEFFDNFLNYQPDAIILNNIEFDHPDYFKDEKQMFESFRRFIGNLRGEKILIFNKDSFGVKRLFEMIGKERLKKLRLYGYTTKNKKIALKRNETNFEIDGEKFKLKVLGKYNVSNALGVIVLGKIFGISVNKIKRSLASFGGIGRRLELIGEKSGVKVYDDYAHHPSAIKVTLAALKQKYPKKKIWVIVEPHTYSRTKALLALYKNVFKDADEVIITPIFKSRDTTDFGISGESIVKISNHRNIKYIDNFDKITTLVCRNVKKEDVIIVMGAGESYKLARNILEKL